MKKCVKCGYELEDNALFCAACGTKQSVAQDSRVQTEDIRDMMPEPAGRPEKVLPKHDPHKNPYVAGNHDLHRNQNATARQDYEELPERAAKRKKESTAEHRQGKRRHPALSVFLLILFFLFFNIGLISLYLRYTFSTEHIEEAILEADISEIEVGGFVEQMYARFEEQLDENEYDDLSDVMEDLFGKVHEDSTFGELISKSELGSDLGGNSKKSGKKALNSLGFKEELADLITGYTSDIFFDSGKGKLDTDDITDLVYAFYSAYYKDALKSARDEGRISEYMYEIYQEQYSGESFRKEIRNSLESDPRFNDDNLKELSVKKLFKDQPLWIARVLGSLIFGAGMVVLGIVFLILSYLVNRRGIKRGLIKTGIILAVEMFLLGFFLIGMKVAESLLTSGSAKAMGNVMIDMMRE